MENETVSFEIYLILLFMKTTETVTDKTDTVSSSVFKSIDEQ